jgi:hypothetical protein
MTIREWRSRIREMSFFNLTSNPQYLVMETRLMYVLKRIFRPFYNGSRSRHRIHVLGMYIFKSNDDSRVGRLEFVSGKGQKR